MANEFKHKSVGTELTQTEFEAVGGHVFDSQATGDIPYAVSSTQISRLGIGSTNDLLTITGGIPAWSSTLTVATIDATTDFTIGTTVITDDVITFTPTASDTVTMTAAANGAFSLVTVDAAAAAANIQITADGTVDIDSAGVLTLDSGAAINIEPATGSAILLDGTISIDAGVVTGATSITSTAFVGDITGDVTGTASTATVATSVTASANNSTDETVYPAFVDGATGTQGIETDTGLTYNPSTGVLTSTSFTGNVTGNVTGNASGTAATVTSGTQASITTVANVVEVGALDAGSITSGFGAIDNGSDTITTTGLVSAGSLTVTGTTTLNGNLILGDAAADTLTVSATIQGATPLVFEGASAGEYETSFAIADPSADRTITFPDLTGTVALTGVAQTWSTTGTVATGALTASGDTIVGNGYGLIVGHSSQVSAGGATSEFQMLGTGSADSRMLLGLWGGTSAPRLVFYKSKNATIGSNTIVADNDDVGDLIYYADDGVDDDTLVARINVQVDDGTPAAGAIGSAIALSTATTGGSLTEALRIDSNQDTSIPLGSKFAFDSGVGDTYIYQESADDLHVVVGNVAMIEIDQDLNSMTFGNSTSPNQSYAFRFDTDKSNAGSTHHMVHLDGTLTGLSGNTVRAVGLMADVKFQTQSEAETLAIAAGIFISEPILTVNGSAAVTTAASLYIADAPSGATTNAAIYVASGDIITLGNIVLDKATPAIKLDSDTGTNSQLWFQEAGANRWVLYNEETVDGDFVMYGYSKNTEVLRIDRATHDWYLDNSLFLNDTANANMTVGLTINQGANDDQILALKSSDVSHGATSIGLVSTETDDFAVIHKASAGIGGWGLTAISDGVDLAGSEMFLVGGNVSNNKTTGGLSAGYRMFVSQHDGSNGYSDVLASGNLFTIIARKGSAWASVWIIDEDGDYFYDGADGGAFDSYDDASLTRAMAVATGGRGVIRDEWDKYVEYNEQTLVDAGILGDTVANGGLVNGAAMQRLHTGAIWQLNTKHMSLAEKVEGLEVELIEAKKQLAAISA